MVVFYKTNSLPTRSKLPDIVYQNYVLRPLQVPFHSSQPQLLCLLTGFILQHNYLRCHFPKCGVCTPVTIREHCSWKVHRALQNPESHGMKVAPFSNSFALTSSSYQESLSLVLNNSPVFANLLLTKKRLQCPYL